MHRLRKGCIDQDPERHMMHILSNLKVLAPTHERLATIHHRSFSLWEMEKITENHGIQCRDYRITHAYFQRLICNIALLSVAQEAW